MSRENKWRLPQSVFTVEFAKDANGSYDESGNGSSESGSHSAKSADMTMSLPSDVKAMLLTPKPPPDSIFIPRFMNDLNSKSPSVFHW